MSKNQGKEYEVVLNIADLLFSVNKNYMINTNCLRIYIGSYSCSRYFLESVKYYQETFRELAKQNHLKVTLVVPIVAQSDWNFVVDTLTSVVTSEDFIDEYVVNDYGMLRMLKKIKEDSRKNFDIIAGRLFHKNFRDKRYLEYTQTPAFVYDSSLLTGIKAMELDLTNSYMDCSELPLNIELYMHYPYTLATSGYVCEFFSVNLPTAVRFR